MWRCNAGQNQDTDPDIDNNRLETLQKHQCKHLGQISSSKWTCFFSNRSIHHLISIFPHYVLWRPYRIDLCSQLLQLAGTWFFFYFNSGSFVQLKCFSVDTLSVLLLLIKRNLQAAGILIPVCHKILRSHEIRDSTSKGFPWVTKIPWDLRFPWKCENHTGCTIRHYFSASSSSRNFSPLVCFTILLLFTALFLEKLELAMNYNIQFGISYSFWSTHHAHSIPTHIHHSPSNICHLFIETN